MRAVPPFVIFAQDSAGGDPRGVRTAVHAAARRKREGCACLCALFFCRMVRG